MNGDEEPAAVPERAWTEDREGAEIRRLRRRLASTTHELETLHASTSWRVTAPLRAVRNALDGLRRRPKSSPGDEPAPVRERLQLRATPGTLLRAVHQLHSIGAAGQPITEAMFGTQRWLREAGYLSDIHVERRDPRLAGRLFTIDDLPEHDRYVLIVRHSTGYDDCARITALPAPKVLLLHGSARFAGGQLDELRPHMRAALADSDHGVLVLRRHGYEAPRSDAALATALCAAGAMPPIEPAWRDAMIRAMRVVDAGEGDAADRPGGPPLVVICQPLERSPLPLAGEVAERSEAGEGASALDPHPAQARRPLPRSGRGNRIGDITLAALDEAPDSLSAVKQINKSFDAAVAPSPHIAKALLDAGVSLPVLALVPEPDRCDQIARFAADLLAAPTAIPPRIGWVSSWNVACGIAAYSRYILDAMPEMDASVLRDDRPPMLGGTDRLRVRPAWTLGDPASAERLARAIATEDADIVVIQHQPGLLSWRDLASLLGDRRLSHRTVAVTLHAAARVLDAEEPDRIIAALAGVARVLVHRAADVDLLAGLGLANNVTLFPQGGPPMRTTPPARALDPGERATIGSFGFFLPGKGIPRLIEAVARLRRDWPSLRLRLVNAAYPGEASDAEIARCRSLAGSLGLGDAVEWNTEFLPDEECQRLLGGCDLLVLPYDPSKESSSAALRGAMASGVPVAVTPIALFDEAGLAVHRFAGQDSETITRGIDALLRDQQARQGLQNAAALWLAERAWPVLGTRLYGMLLGLRASRLAGGRM